MFFDFENKRQVFLDSSGALGGVEARKGENVLQYFCKRQIGEAEGWHLSVVDYDCLRNQPSMPTIQSYFDGAEKYTACGGDGCYQPVRSHEQTAV